jgi:hypothetical protein
MKRLNPYIFNQVVNSGVVNCPPQLNRNSVVNWSNNGTINPNVVEHLNSYLTNPLFFQQIQTGPYEIHPYLERENEHYDLNKRYLMLGTFPPNSYMRNIPNVNIPAENTNVGNIPNVDFYYGNLASLWDCFGVGGNPELNEVKKFLANNNVAVSDVILGAQRKIFNNAADSVYQNIVLNDNLVNVFKSNSNIENILFTSGKLSHLKIEQDGNLNLNNRLSALTGFVQILIDSQIDFEISGDVTGDGEFYPFTNIGIEAALAQQNNHIIWWVKTKNKKLRIINLPAPSMNANQQIPRSPLFSRWVIWKAINNNIIPPIFGQNLMRDYLPQHNIFIHPFTTQYKRDIYFLALNDLMTLQTI